MAEEEKDDEEMMAPTTTIETVTITRPLKVIAFICGLIVIILMIMGLASTDWLMAAGWRQGLFVHCIEENAQQPLPFNLQDPPGCYQSRDSGNFVSILIALIIYPVCFARELNLGNRTIWEFGWAYGVGWGAAIFLFGGVVLLMCDKENEQIYYKERKIVHDNDSRA
ncbi:uncharacterized protein LOC108738076 [Agrilus planipennis]|uniref:Uncharacterized protein LOC108738076 n=1 Tax=Agrilus planipennis TaxID=224129 RepID=A0A1W4X201_AGRPL|nr:uncharacterized protein LOC108738076 [Agrilus planipennis]